MLIRGRTRVAPTVVLPCALLAAGLVLGVPGARAQNAAPDNPELVNAQHDLESAKGHLQAAPHDYGGHRQNAVEHINKALEQVKMGLNTVEHKERKAEKKENRLEKKLDATKAREEKLKK
jgi:septal ring factor EnvC (AmiA/AmiB activator)